MRLTIIGSNSQGNCYILQNDEEALIIECGVNISRIKEALNFKIRKVAGCILTHEHGDHAASLADIGKLGINTYSSFGTFEACKIRSHRHKVLVPLREQQIGNFKVLPFDTKHDAAQPLGFFIQHAETGNILFLTDTMYSQYKFRGMHNLIIEANFSQAIIKQKQESGVLPKFLKDRVISSHLSIENCVSLLEANDLSQVNNIVLIHLSDGNSDEADFKTQVEKCTGKNVFVARANMEIDNFNKTPF